MTVNRFIELLWAYRLPKIEISGEADKEKSKEINRETVVASAPESAEVYWNPAVTAYSLQQLERLGREYGWLEEQDILFGEKEIERKDAARIVHQYLRLELQEADEADWQPAMQLQDLFDCRVCVNHVAQVYVKGIMTAQGNVNRSNNGTITAQGNVFGMHAPVGEEEVQALLARVFYKELRISLANTQKDSTVVSTAGGSITYQQAMMVMKQNPDYLLIDVRTAAEYERWHLEHAVHITMAEILAGQEIPAKPESAHKENQTDRCMLLYCNQGYQSEVAAGCLVEHGYDHVYFLGVTQEEMDVQTEY